MPTYMNTRSKGLPLTTVSLPPSRRNRVNQLALRASPGPDVPLNDAVHLSRSVMDPHVNAAAVLRFEDSGRVAQPGQGRRGEQGVISSGRVIPRGNCLSRVDTRTATTSSGIKRVIRRKGASVVEARRHIAAKRLLKEAQTIEQNAPSGCHAAPKSDDLYEWAAVIEGPEGTVYCGGTFFCNIYIPRDYPFNPPKVLFQTRIYHCNINAQGEVCLDLLKDKWNATMDIALVLKSLLSLMYDCNPDDALVCPIGKQFKEDREQFDKTARLWTMRYAC